MLFVTETDVEFVGAQEPICESSAFVDNVSENTRIKEKYQE
jgi:hypothetical protein